MDGELADYARQAPIAKEIGQALAIEAALRAGEARPVERSAFALDPDGALFGKGRASFAGPGPALNAFHTITGADLIRDFANEEEIYPTRCSYIYCQPSDYFHLHNDVSTAHITIVVALSGDPEPLKLYPFFGAVSEKDVSLLNQIEPTTSPAADAALIAAFGERARAEEIQLSNALATIISGRGLTHAQFSATAPYILAAMSYSFFSLPRHLMQNT